VLDKWALEEMRLFLYCQRMRFWFSTVVALVVAGVVNAALLFQDRHTGANGEETVYRFETSPLATTSPIDQTRAVKVAKVWAGQYYGIAGLTVANAQERSLPIHFWLIAFTAPGQSKGGTYYSIVLPNGSVVEPRVSRQGLTASANPVDVTKDTELKAPVKGLEVHGEIIFTYGFGKGLRCYGPYVPSPVWDGPPAR
jgi:hypothetical protein